MSSSHIRSFLVVLVFSTLSFAQVYAEGRPTRVQAVFEYEALSKTRLGKITHGPDGFEGIIEGPAFKIFFTVGCCVGLPEPFLLPGGGFRVPIGTSARTENIAGRDAMMFRRPMRNHAGGFESAFLIKTKSKTGAELVMTSAARNKAQLVQIEGLYRSVRFLRR